MCRDESGGPHVRGTGCLAEDVRANIAALSIPHATSTIASRVTASLRVVTGFCYQENSPGNLLVLADRQLYAAKTGGRHRVSAAVEDDGGREDRTSPDRSLAIGTLKGERNGLVLIDRFVPEGGKIEVTTGVERARRGALAMMGISCAV